MREAEIEKYLVRRVKELGGEVRKVEWVGRRGAPDRLVMFGREQALGHLCGVVAAAREGDLIDEQEVLDSVLGLASAWVELKAPGVRPEAHQVREHERLRAMGQRVVVIDSIEGVEELLS